MCECQNLDGVHSILREKCCFRFCFRFRFQFQFRLRSRSVFGSGSIFCILGSVWFRFRRSLKITFSVVPSMAKLAVGSKQLSLPGRQKVAGFPSDNLRRISVKLATIISNWAFSAGFNTWILHEEKVIYLAQIKFV
jgi:hypothetical protein